MFWTKFVIATLQNFETWLSDLTNFIENADLFIFAFEIIIYLRLETEISQKRNIFF